MSDAIGGARRCSRVQKTRYCWKCERTVDSGHKFIWIPVNKKGYYRLQHRNCDFPDCYDHDPGTYHKRQSSKFAALHGEATPAQLAYLEEERP